MNIRRWLLKLQTIDSVERTPRSGQPWSSWTGDNIVTRDVTQLWRKYAIK